MENKGFVPDNVSHYQYQAEKKIYNTFRELLKEDIGAVIIKKKITILRKICNLNAMKINFREVNSHDVFREYSLAYDRLKNFPNELINVETKYQYLESF